MTSKSAARENHFWKCSHCKSRQCGHTGRDISKIPVLSLNLQSTLCFVKLLSTSPASIKKEHTQVKWRHPFIRLNRHYVKSDECNLFFALLRQRNHTNLSVLVDLINLLICFFKTVICADDVHFTQHAADAKVELRWVVHGVEFVQQSCPSVVTEIDIQRHYFLTKNQPMVLL